MRRAVNAVTDGIFPGVHVFQEADREQFFRGPLASDDERVSSLPLQMALYFNALYFPFWLLVAVSTLDVKYPHLSPVYRVVVIAVVVAVALVEAVRLYLGYVGNLTEMIPELAGSWLLTSILQLPLQAFLSLNEATLPLPMERAANAVLVAFVVAELLLGYFAIRKVSRRLTTKFHLHTFDVSRPT